MFAMPGRRSVVYRTGPGCLQHTRTHAYTYTYAHPNPHTYAHPYTYPYAHPYTYANNRYDHGQDT